MTLNKIFLFAAMTLLPLQHAFSAPVETVQVRVCDVNGSTSQILLDKMSLSMQVVAEQLFLNKDSEVIKNATNDYQHLLTEVGDRVFSGYELTQVDLSTGTNTEIVLYARPWGSVINHPKIDIQFSGIEPESEVLLKKRIPALEAQLKNTISGASVDAGDWTNGVLRKIVRNIIEEQLPEFKAAVDTVTENGQTIVQVVIYPVGQVVQNIRYEMHSEEIPNILLMNLKYKYAKKCATLRGLPLAYVKNHRLELEKQLQDSLLEEKVIKNYNLRPVVTLVSETDLGIDILLRSDEYKIWFEGYGDIGRKEDNLSGKAHLGKYISSNDEIFTEAEVILDEVKWRFGIGYARYWGKSILSCQRRMPVGDNVYKFEYILTPQWRLRAEHFSSDNRNEFAVRYRIHEFLSAEYVYGDDEFYLRVIGNL